MFVKNDQNWKIIRMGFSIVENVPTSNGIFFNLFRGSQLNFGKKYKNPAFLLIWGPAAGGEALWILTSLIFLFGVFCWGHRGTWHVW